MPNPLPELIETARSRGYITYAELESVLPEGGEDCEELDDALARVDAATLRLVEAPEDREEREGTSVHDEDDPVEHYLRLACDVSDPVADGAVYPAEAILGQGVEAEEAKVRLLQANSRLVVLIARAMHPRSIHVLDLIQLGNEELLRAVNEYDPGRGYRFSIFAQWRVRRAMAKALQESEIGE